MKNSSIVLGIVILIVLVGGFVLLSSNGSSNSSTGDVSANSNSQTQKIVMSYLNGNYFPRTINVKVGQPVEITIDSSVKGCYRTFVIRDLGIQKTFSSNNDVLTFKPQNKGTFGFACGMGMGFGTMIVD